MTTGVKVSAHCGSNKQVRIVRSRVDEVEDIILEDGQTYESVVYDEILISVREEFKPERA